mgnify:CR=1 FL=1
MPTFQKDSIPAPYAYDNSVLRKHFRCPFVQKVNTALSAGLFKSGNNVGPLILSASSHIRDMERGRYKILIDMKPALDFQTLDKQNSRKLISVAVRACSRVGFSPCGYQYGHCVKDSPALDFQTLDKRLQRDFSENPNRIFANSLSKLLPSKMIPVVVSAISLDSIVFGFTSESFTPPLVTMASLSGRKSLTVAGKFLSRHGGCGGKQYIVDS